MALQGTYWLCLPIMLIVILHNIQRSCTCSLCCWTRLFFTLLLYRNINMFLYIWHVGINPLMYEYSGSVDWFDECTYMLRLCFVCYHRAYWLCVPRTIIVWFGYDPKSVCIICWIHCSMHNMHMYKITVSHWPFSNQFQYLTNQS